MLLTASIPPTSEPATLRYEAPSGALARVDGRACGAFDREHRAVAIPPSARERTLVLEVERRSLPTNGLPPGPGLRWALLNRRAAAAPGKTVVLEPADGAPAAPPAAQGGLALWGHSHLDVAWLWTYGECKRKAARTFANALALLDADPSFVFMQSQPQLYEFVREEDSELFDRVVALAAQGRFDPDVAALWVEPDCNVPSGESLLRQMLAAQRYCAERFGATPSIAWLPDTFGFSRTLPTLLAHARIPYFATTKLLWNDTTRFPYAQFRWRGSDGSEVLAASIAGMDSGCSEAAAERARRREEPLVVGYGDGGGGPTREQVEEARSLGRWERPRAWFERLGERRSDLPVHDDELYLEYHRGTYTTHHDMKAANAALERRLRDVEELAAWCVAVRAPNEALARVRAALRDVWEIVLRNQFHDVLPGTSIAPVYEDARREYARANELAENAAALAGAMLPRAARAPASGAAIPPAERDGDYVFENEALTARVRPTGALAELRRHESARNVVAQANLLATYRDRPKKWEAWNIDAGYERTRKPARPRSARVEDGALAIPFDVAGSPATMRVSLCAREPFLRVELAIDWNPRRTLLRLENWLTVDASHVTWGAPHGTVVRPARADTPQRRARFEVPGQRFAVAANDEGDGVALLTLDTYGWSARALGSGGLQLGHSLLRSTAWPDPRADRGRHDFSWAFAPLHRARASDVERLWLSFSGASGVRLFVAEDPALLVAACKPAEDGDGVIVRVRECDGIARELALRCGGRMREAASVDACERNDGGDARIDGERLFGAIRPYGLRSFRVRF